MRRLILAALLLVPVAGQAEPPASELPPVMLVPTKYLLRLQSLLSDPLENKAIPLYQADFAPLLQAFEDCAKLQIPDAKPVPGAKECPEVAAALQAKTTPLAQKSDNPPPASVSPAPEVPKSK
jgi:hypothetical protein